MNMPTDGKQRVWLAEGQEVGLGCGTLILIAIIVMIFSGDSGLEREVKELRSEISSLEEAVETQSDKIDQLLKRLE